MVRDRAKVRVRRRRTLAMTKALPTFLVMWTLFVMIVAMFRGESSISLYLSLKDSEVLLGKAVSKIEEENAKLESEIHYIKTSKTYAKKVLRDRYHVTEEGEKIIYFAD